MFSFLGYVEVIKKPFKAFLLKHFFKTASLARIIEKKVKRLNFELKKNDLYTLRQSKDLKSFSRNTCFYWIRQVFDAEVRYVLEKLFKITLDGSMSISVSQYKDTGKLIFIFLVAFKYVVISFFKGSNVRVS